MAKSTKTLSMTVYAQRRIRVVVNLRTVPTNISTISYISMLAKFINLTKFRKETIWSGWVRNERFHKHSSHTFNINAQEIVKLP